MEKYGVDEDFPQDEKEAVESKERCPKCGATLSDPRLTGVLHCPSCGTKPFEGK